MTLKSTDCLRQGSVSTDSFRSASGQRIRNSFWSTALGRVAVMLLVDCMAGNRIEARAWDKSLNARRLSATSPSSSARGIQLSWVRLRPFCDFLAFRDFEDMVSSR
jgi:hypothetical protein